MLMYAALTRKDNAGGTAWHLLIVEDDPEMGMGLADFFGLKGYAVTQATDGQQATDLLQPGAPFDLVLLDVMLPHKSGFEVLQAARAVGVETPVMMLTAKGRERDKLEGFGLGADDYVTKPFSAEELAARVKAVLHRTRHIHPTQTNEMEVYTFDDLTVNFSNHTAERAGRPLRFTAMEFNILHYLIERRGMTVTRKQLLRDVWNIDENVATRTIDRHMASIRKKIDPAPDAHTLIQTVYGIGYKFVG